MTPTTIEELDALPVGSIVLFGDGYEVARKPHGNDFPSAIPGYWETVGSELGTDAWSIIHAGPVIVVFTPKATS